MAHSPGLGPRHGIFVALDCQVAEEVPVQAEQPLLANTHRAAGEAVLVGSGQTR